MPQNILFVCSQNRLRSPTAEAIFSGRENWEVRSVGTDQTAARAITEADVTWANIIVSMELCHKLHIRKTFPNALKTQRLVCLDIPDEYDFMDEALIKILNYRVAQYLDL